MEELPKVIVNLKGRIEEVREKSAEAFAVEDTTDEVIENDTRKLKKEIEELENKIGTDEITNEYTQIVFNNQNEKESEVNSNKLMIESDKIALRMLKSKLEKLEKINNLAPKENFDVHKMSER